MTFKKALAAVLLPFIAAIGVVIYSLPHLLLLLIAFDYGAVGGAQLAILTGLHWLIVQVPAMIADLRLRRPGR